MTVTPMSAATARYKPAPKPKPMPGWAQALTAFAAVVVPAAGLVATLTADQTMTDTRLMLGGGFIALGFGSLIALVTHRRNANSTFAL